MQVYVHKVVRIALMAFSLIFMAAALYMVYETKIQSNVSLIAFTGQPIIGWSLAVILAALSLLCLAVTLFYREPIHELSHDAIMDSLDTMVIAALVYVHQGGLESVPKHRHAEAVAQWLQQEYRSLDARFAAVVGQIAEVYLRATDGIGEEELQKLEHRLTDVQAQEEQTRAALESAAAVITDIATRAQRAEVVAEGNDTEYARLRRLIAEASDTLDKIAPARSNVHVLHRD